MAAAVLWLGSITVSHGQEPVSTGIVQGLVPAAGTLTIRSDQTSSALTFYGMERANIFTSDGALASIDSVQPGMPVTVQYAVRGNRWYISKVILPEERLVPVTPGLPAPVYLAPGLNSRAAWDNDITTQPGSRALIDNDITTQPGSRAAIDNDITTQPGSLRNSNGGIQLRRQNP